MTGYLRPKMKTVQYGSKFRRICVWFPNNLAEVLPSCDSLYGVKNRLASHYGRDKLPYSVGVLCPERLGYKFLPYILKVVQRVRRIDRKRPLQEMLLMMWRSSRREIVKARKEVNGNDEP